MDQFKLKNDKLYLLDEDGEALAWMRPDGRADLIRSQQPSDAISFLVKLDVEAKRTGFGPYAEQRELPTPPSGWRWLTHGGHVPALRSECEFLPYGRAYIEDNSKLTVMGRDINTDVMSALLAEYSDRMERKNRVYHSTEDLYREDTR